MKKFLFQTLLFLVVFAGSSPTPAEAYIGPGAGFAVVSSLFVVLAAFFLSILTLLTWPVRWLFRLIRRSSVVSKSRVSRVVVVGLDGQDPHLTESFIREGILPNFARLRDQGSYRRLQTTLPAESPVAWSSFQTGCNPGRHGVFDFLVPNRKTYLPELCSARIDPPTRALSLGRYRIPLGKPRIRFGRKSQSFWKILGDHDVFSTVLRVPITFPPERFNGLLLSAMSVPDLIGTQGTFSYYSTETDSQQRLTGGNRVKVEVQDGAVESFILGPKSPFEQDGTPMQIPFEVNLGGDSHKAELFILGKRYPLRQQEYTPWIPLSFGTGPLPKIRGLCRFYLMETSPHFKLYVSPINIDPNRPALPISHPFTYSMYLARTQGDFSTLGLAEDTWALNERVIDEEAFLKQAYLIHEERERMFFDALAKTNRGLVVCVFDITDRLQHMFWRYLEDDHPANEGKDTEKHRNEIRRLYQRMDDLVGRVIDASGEDTVVMVMSDHGFKSFKRGVNLNSWLQQNGYLVLKEKASGAEWYQDVDWKKTRAFAVGLGGIYLNRAGREAQGIVQPGEEEKQLKQEIRERLRKLRDDEITTEVVGEVYDTLESYAGPYRREAPDLVVGFNPGYRVSWSNATGAVAREVFEDNTKSWSGDHCVNPPDVPGILFCNREIRSEQPRIIDIGPTILDLFGVAIPSYCDGKSFMPEEAVIDRVGSPTVEPRDSGALAQ